MKYPYKSILSALNKLFVQYGVENNIANEVALHLINSDLFGHPSHGIARAPMYIDKIIKGELNPNGKIRIENQTESTATIDGHWNFGQIIARKAIEIAIDKACSQNISCVTIKNSNHIGRLGEYTSTAASKGMIGIGTANLHGTSHVVAPFGGIDRKLPTNPISIATPGSAENKLFLMDMASSIIAEGKLKISHNNQEEVGDNLIIDSEGNPTNNTQDFYNDPKGSILSLGGISGHKGFALSLAIDVISGALSSAGCSHKTKSQHGNACCFIVININAFTTLQSFRANINSLEKHVRSTRLSKGFQKIQFPGEPEADNYKNNKKYGIEIDPITIKELCKLADKVSLNFIESIENHRLGEK